MEMCNKSETNDLDETITNAGELESIKFCGSPVFKCVTHTKSARGNHLDSSDYDIPSYQINQSEKTRTCNKYGNETSESVLPFSPVVSPVSVASKIRFQPPSTHTVGTVVKNLDKTCKNKVSSRRKSGGIFDVLGMTDKDISWASSMASPPPEQVPGSEFNTIEKATFLPEEKFHSIQPRALFSPPLDDDFGCQPITFTSESDDEDTEYKSNIRLSDVCSTLKQLEFKSSLDQTVENSLEKVTVKEPSLKSPVIRTKKIKVESAKKKKKGSLVISPESNDKYEFSTNLNTLDCEKVPCSDSNFIEDDSFQSLSFSCLDELCKTLAPSQEDNSSLASSNKILISSTDNNSKQNNLKKFYLTKSSADVYEVSSMDSLHCYVKALEEGDTCIPECKKIDQSFAGKGIVRCDVLTSDSSKMDACKRLHSEVTGESDECKTKKLKKVDDEWENMKQYLSESQLNVSDGEIFRTVENLEKTLASQERKNLEKLSGEVLQDQQTFLPQNSTLLSTDNSGMREEMNSGKAKCVDELGDCGKRKCDAEDSVPFRDSDFKISTNHEGLKNSSKLHDISKSGSLERNMVEECSADASKQKKIPSEALNLKISDRTLKVEKNKTLSKGGESSEKDQMFERTDLGKCDVKNQHSDVTSVMEGFFTCSGKKIQISAKALEKAKAFMAQCDEKLGDLFTEDFGEGSEKQKLSKQASKSDAPSEEKPGEPSDEFSTHYSKKTGETFFPEKAGQNSTLFKGFSTGSGKTIHVSAEALEKAKALMINCDREVRESSNQFGTTCVEELVNQTLEVQKEKTVDDLKEKPQKEEKFLPKGEIPVNLENPKADESLDLQKVEPPLLGFVTARGSKVTISESALAKAKQRMNEWERIKPEESGDIDCVTENLQKSEIVKLEESKSKPSTTSGFDESDDWDEIIPSWLHVYNTSPSIISDRTELSPILTHEDGRTLKSDREYILRSPVFGSGDRFQGKSKKRKLQFEDEKKPEKKTGFVVPYKNAEKKEKTKRTLNLSLDFSVPFKKSRMSDDVTDVCLSIKAERARMREEQEKSIREKQKVKIMKGSHLSRKLAEKQVVWVEAVKGCSPQVHSQEVLRKFGVSEAVLDVNVETALSVRLKGEDYFGVDCKTNTTGIPVGDDCLLILDDENKFGVDELKRAFLASPGVQPNLVPSGWVENHCKWIIWKLAHYEKSFPQFLAGCLTPNQILVQLRYRYDREIDRNERSALKKILERDDTSVKRLVLCVCGIKKVTGGECVGYELKLTDGWYNCSARSDPAMTKLIEQGKLPIGTKLLTQGATLVNCEQGASPLEISDDTYLKISTNSTRRVRWDTKLGFQKNPKNFPISLASILPHGGPISRLDVIVVRTYPVLYMEKTSDGHHVTRNRRLEEKADAEYRRIQEKRMESIYDEVQSELRKSANFEKEQPESNESDRFGRELAERIQKKLEIEKMKKRNVSEFLRAKIVDFRKPDYNNPAVLSVWNPNEDLIGFIAEGKVISLTNVAINNSTRLYKPLQINTTRQTQYSQISRSVKYPSRKLTKLKDVSSKVCPAFEEVDVVGMVSLIRDISYGSRMSQVVYLTDFEMNFVSVVFWGSCKDYGWENVLRTSSIVSCSNLQWKKNHAVQDVPSLHVNENSVFTENPRQSYLKEEMERLKQNRPQDITDFLSKCEENLTTKLENSKWRMNGSKNSSSNDSTLRDPRPAVSSVVNGFESKPTASSTPIKPFNVGLHSNEAEPSPIQKRIEKLQSYGEPSPLIPLIVTGKKKSRKPLGGLTTR